MEDDDLQQWLDEGSAQLAKEAADRKVWERQNKMPTVRDTQPT